MKTVLYIVLGGVIAFLILWSSDVREKNTTLIYDGCIEQFVVNEVPSENFISFMQDCMDRYSEPSSLSIEYK